MEAPTPAINNIKEDPKAKPFNWLFASLWSMVLGIVTAIVLAWFIASKTYRGFIAYNFFYPIVIGMAVAAGIRSVVKTNKSMFWGCVAANIAIIAIFLFDFLIITHAHAACAEVPFMDVFKAYWEAPGLYIAHWKEVMHKFGIPFYFFNVTLACLMPFLTVATNFNEKIAKYNSKRRSRRRRIL